MIALFYKVYFENLKDGLIFRSEFETLEKAKETIEFASRSKGVSRIEIIDMLEVEECEEEIEEESEQAAEEETAAVSCSDVADVI